MDGFSLRFSPVGASDDKGVDRKNHFLDKIRQKNQRLNYLN